MRGVSSHGKPTRILNNDHSMAFKVHKFEIDMEKDQEKLEQFLNRLKGEVVSIIPNVARTSLAQIYGSVRKVDFLLVVEKVPR